MRIKLTEPAETAHWEHVYTLLPKKVTDRSGSRFWVWGERIWRRRMNKTTHYMIDTPPGLARLTAGLYGWWVSPRMEAYHAARVVCVREHTNLVTLQLLDRDATFETTACNFQAANRGLVREIREQKISFAYGNANIDREQKIPRDVFVEVLNENLLGHLEAGFAVTYEGLGGWVLGEDLGDGWVTLTRPGNDKAVVNASLDEIAASTVVSHGRTLQER